MGHNIGISASYYKPTAKEVFEDYLKADPLLTINAGNLILRQKVEELTEKSKDNEYIISGRLAEKDKQIEDLIKKQNQFEQLLQTLIDSGQFKPGNTH